MGPAHNESERRCRPGVADPSATVWIFAISSNLWSPRGLDGRESAWGKWHEHMLLYEVFLERFESFHDLKERTRDGGLPDNFPRLRYPKTPQAIAIIA